MASLLPVISIGSLGYLTYMVLSHTYGPPSAEETVNPIYYCNDKRSLQSDLDLASGASTGTPIILHVTPIGNGHYTVQNGTALYEINELGLQSLRNRSDISIVMC
jgi:hypothetical protein